MGFTCAVCVFVAARFSSATAAVLFALLLLIVLGLVGYAIGMRNELVKMSNGIDKSFAEIDRLLKQRHDEVPKLLETCRPYLEHDPKTLQPVAEARGSYMHASTPGQKAQADRLVSGALRNLWAAAAKNPDLKRNTSFVQVQDRIGQLETKLGAQRDRYNEEVNRFNTRIARLPDAFAARLAKLHARERFQARSSDT